MLRTTALVLKRNRAGVSGQLIPHHNSRPALGYLYDTVFFFFYRNLLLCGVLGTRMGGGAWLLIVNGVLWYLSWFLGKDKTLELRMIMWTSRSQPLNLPVVDTLLWNTDLSADYEI